MNTHTKTGPNAAGAAARIVLSRETGRFIVPPAVLAQFAELHARRIDIDAELSAAAAWCVAHQQRLYGRDFGRFVGGWLLRAASRARPALRLVSVRGAA